MSVKAMREGRTLDSLAPYFHVLQLLVFDLNLCGS